MSKFIWANRMRFIASVGFLDEGPPGPGEQMGPRSLAVAVYVPFAC